MVQGPGLAQAPVRTKGYSYTLLENAPGTPEGEDALKRKPLVQVGVPFAYVGHCPAVTELAALQQVDYDVRFVLSSPYHAPSS